MARKIKVTKFNNKGDGMGKHTKTIGTPMSMEDYINDFSGDKQSIGKVDLENYSDDFEDELQYEEPEKMHEEWDVKQQSSRQETAQQEKGNGYLIQMIIDRMNLMCENTIDGYLIGNISKEEVKELLDNIEDRVESLVDFLS